MPRKIARPEGTRPSGTPTSTSDAAINAARVPCKQCGSPVHPYAQSLLHVEGADNVPLYWPVIDVGRYERVLLLVKPDDVERS